jgi:hypothetical protein
MNIESKSCDDDRGPRVCVSLTLEDVAWVAELAASVVKNNSVAKPPREWRSIPDWWKAVGEVDVGLSVGVGDECLVEDTLRAVGVLEGLKAVPRPCPFGPHG